MSLSLSIRTRFTLLYGAALVITVIAVASSIYFYVRQALIGQIENHLRKDSTSITEMLKNDLEGLRSIATHGPIELFSVAVDDRLIVASDGWRHQQLDALSDEQATGSLPASRKSPLGRSFRLQTEKVKTGGVSYLVTVAHQEETLQQALRALWQIILFMLPVSVAASLAIGYLIAGRVLAPITAITAKAREISAENLAERLPEGASDDELGHLAQVFNGAFGRIEESFNQLKRFTADASHELRTPLAAIRSIGETALQQHSQSCECRETLGSILEESDRLRQMIDSLLILSRGDAGEIPLKREPTDLAQLMGEVIDLLSILAEEKQQSIIIENTGTVIVLIDRATIRQALINLLENAIAYSPASSSITIAIKRAADGSSRIEISDHGPGIPAEHLPFIFDRFYRVDKGRSRERGGAGLGLSIAQRAAAMNGGRIDVVSTETTGSVFTLVVPST